MPAHMSKSNGSLQDVRSSFIGKSCDRVLKERSYRGVDKRRTLWVLVRGEISRRDALLDMEEVSVLEAGVYE